MTRQDKSAAERAPDTGALPMPGLDAATAALLEQAGELVVGGRLYVKDRSREPRAAAKVRADAAASVRT
jgi:hypothetical protein